MFLKDGTYSIIIQYDNRVIELEEIELKELKKTKSTLLYVHLTKELYKSLPIVMPTYIYLYNFVYTYLS